MNPIADALSQTFAALSDPTRRAMLARLMQGEATVNELAAPFKMSLPAISKHIKVLEKAGLLIKTRQAQQRPCKINGEQFRRAMAWLEPYRQVWEGRLDRLDASLPEQHAAESVAKAEASKPVKSKRSARTTPAAKEKEDDRALQEQIGFDF